MPNFDRGMIKWQPFNSVISNKQLVSEVLYEKSKINMPTLSEEQRKNIEQRLVLAFYECEAIKICYYYQGKIYELNETIKKIDSTYRKIYFNNKTLLFDQIVKVY